MDHENEVRKAARAYHDAQQLVRNMSIMNTPTDADAARIAYEELEVARAEETRAYRRLLKAKFDFSKT